MIERLKRYTDEFKTFAMRGNVIDMAVGIIIGAAFGKIVDSLVKDVIMPPLGWMLGKVDFANMFIALPDYEGNFITYATLDAAKEAGAVTINYGLFINTLISFVLVAFSVFLLIKGINKLRAEKKVEEIDQAPTTKDCPHCFSQIDIRATKCPNCTADI
ncbi:MAG: large-conductance mechanosensitive channel protein MscL [Cyanobacteria bacterium SIG26]|nr:large-conductance mechanosensitive channel protein MscL [Cyanobacteria bacterium SIG26]